MSTQTSSMPDPDSSSVTLERICDGQALIATVANNSRTTIDRFVEVIKTEQQDWPADRVGYLVADLSRTLGGFNTPYGRAKMGELMESRPDSPYYVAVVSRNNMLLAMGRVFLNSLPQKTIHTRICFTRQEATAWIEENIAKNKQAA